MLFLVFFLFLAIICISLGLVNFYDKAFNEGRASTWTQIILQFIGGFVMCYIFVSEIINVR